MELKKPSTVQRLHGDKNRRQEVITHSAVPLSATSTGSYRDIEPQPGFARSRFQRIVTALCGCFRRETDRPAVNPQTNEAITPSGTPLNQRGASSYEALSPVMSQRFLDELQADSLSMFSAERLFPDSLFPDPSASDAYIELGELLDDNPFGAVKIAQTLWLAWKTNKHRIINAYYGNNGRFCHLKPNEEGKHFARACSSLLDLNFTKADEALRQEAMRHFTWFCQVERLSSAESHPDNLQPSDQFAQQVFSDFVKGVHRSVSLEQAFKKWEHDGLDCAELPKSDTSLYRLMIEGSLCKKANRRFMLDNEAGYLERCYRAFMFLLNILANSPGKKLSLNDINQAGAIVGSSLCSRDFSYGLLFDNAENHPCFIKMMEESMILNGSHLSNKKFAHRLVPLLKCPLYRKGNEMYSEKALQKKLAGPHFDIVLKHAADEMMEFSIDYRSENKQKDGQEIIDDYYKKVATKTHPLDIIEVAVDACCQLQRRHLFDDGNGRVQYFILLPVLLCQQGLWLTENLDSPWDLVDSVPPRAIAEQLLPLCKKRPVFTAPLDWQAGVPEAERVRLLCAMGKTEALAEAIQQQPEWLQHTFRPTNQTLLSIAAHHNQGDIVKHILNHYPESVELAAITEELRYLEKHSYDKSVIELIRQFHDQHVINNDLGAVPK